MSMLEFVAPRMLIVDDIEDNRVILGRSFAKRGYDIIEADSGAMALHLIEQMRIDVVMLDIMMPVMSGIETLHRIRSQFSAEKLPVVMVTARTDVTDLVQALEFGANDYITKPVDFAIAFARVTGQLERKRAQDTLERTVTRLTSTVRQLELEMVELRKAEASVAHFDLHHDPVARVVQSADSDLR